MENYTIFLNGRIDSGNVTEVEQKLNEELPQDKNAEIILDADKLEYISSAGLRMILRTKKTYPDLKIVNVNSEVYEIFEMTGFTEIIQIEKAYRTVSVEGCEVIGEGAKGKVYRIDGDNVVKTYKNADALSEILHEREVARLALVLGVPTAISYDVVKVGNSYGSVFEMLNAKSFSKILANEPDRFNWCVSEYVGILKKIHGISVPDGKLPSAKQKILGKIERVQGSIPEESRIKIKKMTEGIPESNHMIHGDYHTKNIVLAGDEVLVIDMDTLSVGHPIFDLIWMYNAYIGYSEYDQSIVLNFQGYSPDIARRFWHDSLAAYLNTNNENIIIDVEKKVRCLSYLSLIEWGTRHNTTDDATMSLWKERLAEIIQEVDSLDFETCKPATTDPNELDVEASAEELEKVIAFVDRHLETVNCPKKAQMQMELAVEEIFINIANYAYAPGKGDATVRVEVSHDPITVIITFIDRGMPYDPLMNKDPDVTLPADERKIGGLGIFMTKKIMDDVSYEYKNGQNILTLKKTI